MKLGGRTPYNLGWRDDAGALHFARMGTIKGPRDPHEAARAIMEHSTLADWASSVACSHPRGGPVLLGLGGVEVALEAP